MTTFIYMNHRIRNRSLTRPRKDRPVIVAQRQDDANYVMVSEDNCFSIVVDGKVVGRVLFDPRKDPSPTHHVKAWVEVDTHLPNVEVRRG